jgi:hypothetical protein
MYATSSMAEAGEPSMGEAYVVPVARSRNVHESRSSGPNAMNGSASIARAVTIDDVGPQMAAVSPRGCQTPSVGTAGFDPRPLHPKQLTAIDDLILQPGIVM